jgi:hypothetical protein
MASHPERASRPQTLAEAKAGRWPLCLCTVPPQIMELTENPAVFRCPACGSTHDRRWFEATPPLAAGGR